MKTFGCGGKQNPEKQGIWQAMASGIEIENAMTGLDKSELRHDNDGRMADEYRKAVDNPNTAINRVHSFEKKGSAITPEVVNYAISQRQNS